jgi:hypothetical protein
MKKAVRVCPSPFGSGGQRERIDEDRFMRYYQVAIKAALMDGPAPSVKDRVIPSIDDAHTDVLNVVFGDNPLSRMTIALKNQMAEEGQMSTFASVLMRIQALIQLIGDGSLRHRAILRPRDPKHLYYPDAVVLAAAVSPLSDDWTFQIDEFDRLVEVRLGGMNSGHITTWAR